MELEQFTTLPFIVTFLVFILILVKQRNKSPLPPGPWKLPIIGHVHHMRGLPHRALADLAKKYKPIMLLKFGEISTLVISSPEVAEQIMKIHDLKFVDRPVNLAAKIVSYGCRGIIVAPYGEYWRQVRKICMVEALSAKRVQSFSSVREEVVSNLIGKITKKAGSPINLSQAVVTVTADITSRSAFGSTCKDKEIFIGLVKEIGRLASGFYVHDLFPSFEFLQVISGTKSKLEKIFQEMDQLLESIIKEHIHLKKTDEKEPLEEDLVDVLLRVQGDKELDVPITTEDVKAVIYDIFAAGIDTSSTALEWTFSELLRNPKVMKKAQAEVRDIFRGKTQMNQADVNELKYMRPVIKESLRLHPPAALILRECRESCKIEGYEIPKGTKVMINAWAIGRDPQHWSEPERFDPDRFKDEDIDLKGTNYKFLPFGSGRRMCPGILFGTASMELTLAHLLYHFDWNPANGVNPEEVDITEDMSISLKKKSNLYVIPTVYRP